MADSDCDIQKPSTQSANCFFNPIFLNNTVMDNNFGGKVETKRFKDLHL